MLPLEDGDPLMNDLQKFHSADLALVNVGYKANLLNFKGFGYLVPREEQEQILGVVWDSSAFPQQNRHPKETRLTVMVDGSHNTCDSQERALRALSRHLGINHEPASMAVKLAHEAIPQYSVGHVAQTKAFLERWNASYPGVTLLGASYEGIAVNECIANARCAVENKCLPSV